MIDPSSIPGHKTSALPFVADITGAEVPVAKGGDSFRAIAGGANGLATLDSEGHIPPEQFGAFEGVDVATLAGAGGAEIVGTVDPASGAVVPLSEVVRFASAGTADPALSLRNAIVRAGASGRGGTVAFVFDDGYRSNFLNALPLFRRFGFAATLAQEIERIGQDYAGNPSYPVCTVEDLRELIACGWEICNHPNLNLASTESEMVAAAQAENQLLRDLLSGAKVKNYSTGAVTSASVTRPEFSDYPITSAVYRGGSRSDTSDRAYRFVFDKVRSINGTLADRGDHLYAFAAGSECTMHMSAWPVDTTSNSLENSLAFIESVAQSGSTAILYGHDTPAGTGGATPYLTSADLERLLQHCHDLGVAVVPLSRLSKGNAIRDTVFSDATGTLAARTGDSVLFSALDTLHGADRCVVLTSSAAVSNNNTQYRTASFVCQPFCRYRVRVRYKIDADLTLAGGTGATNQGMNIALVTGQSNTGGNAACNDDLVRLVLNDGTSSIRLPYLATTGYDEVTCELVTGFGQQGTVVVALTGCVGTVRIGQIAVEKLDCMFDRPLSGTHTFNTTTYRQLSLPAPNTVNGRRWRWEVSVIADPLEPSATYSYASADPAGIAAPAEGDTCYVIGVGVGAFLNQGGKLATYTSGAWAFSAIPNGTFFKVSNAEGILNRWFLHRGIKTDKSPLFLEAFAPAIQGGAVVKYVSSSVVRVFNVLGTRVDTFTWIAKPYSG